MDGIKYLIHEGGCGGTTEDYQALCNLLAGYIAHPNVAGATLARRAHFHDGPFDDLLTGDLNIGGTLFNFFS